MARIYLTGSGPTKGYVTGSGILSNPVRVLLQERDNKTGSYPTIARSGDPDFSGIYSTIFDDTNTINFVSQQVIYPTNLPRTSKFVSGGVATPNILQGISASAISVPGVADSHITLTPGQNLSPFNDSRIYVENNSSFYKTGTSPSILSGFDQRLSSKTILQFDINPLSRTNFFFSTGTVPGPSVGGIQNGVNSGIGYFNWNTKKWEIIGDLSTGSYVDYVNPNPAIRDRTPRAFTSRCEFYPYAQGFSTVNQTVSHIGIPHSTNGFPFATQFDATGSQILKLTGSLTAPFLVEKIALEFSASFPAFRDTTTSASSFAEGPNVYQFFLLNVSAQNVNSTVTIEQALTGSNTGAIATRRISNFSVRQVKDLIWTGEISRYDNYPTPQSFEWQRDLNLSGSSSAGAPGISAITGTYRVEAPARVFGISSGLLTTPIRSDGASPVATTPLLANRLGGRNFAGISEGRSFIKSVAGSAVSGTLYVDDTDVNYMYAIPLISQVKFDSPYVLMPGDSLVLGFANQAIISGGPTGAAYVDYTEKKISEQVVTLSPGAGKITIYGSFLRNNLPEEQSTNQPLTSDAVHEDIHYDNPVFDQFDSDSTLAFTGSYIDNIVAGSMELNPFSANARRVVGSAVSGTAGVTGSLQRFVSIPSYLEILENGRGASTTRIYDTNVPEISDFLTKLGATAEDLSSAGAPYGTHTVLLRVNNPISYSTINFVRSYPFARQLSSVKRTLTPESIFSTPIFNGRGKIGTLSSIGFGYFDDATDITYIFGASSAGNTQAYQSAIKTLFCFNRSKVSGSYVPDIGPDAAGAGYSAGEIPIRGFKYGLGGIYGLYPTAKFRRDRFGQFRDMLEQRGFFASLVTRDVDYPIEINFYSRPNRDGTGVDATEPSLTHSQNLSKFNTSSLPYFDGVAVDRDEDPDVSLRDLPAIFES
jgi:hypothetical protein